MSITCPRCGSDNRDNSPNCINCGAPLSVAPVRDISQPSGVYQKPCINCNRMINSSLPTCPYCGANQSIRTADQFTAAVNQFAPMAGQQHNKLVAGLLAIFLGTFGVHKFYLGQSVQGILYLIFCWTGIPTVVGIIEGIMYLTMQDNAFYQKYR